MAFFEGHIDILLQTLQTLFIKMFHVKHFDMVLQKNSKGSFEYYS